jgi:hypothetical protein
MPETRNPHSQELYSGVHMFTHMFTSRRSALIGASDVATGDPWPKKRILYCKYVFARLLLCFRTTFVVVCSVRRVMRGSHSHDIRYCKLRRFFRAASWSLVGALAARGLNPITAAWRSPDRPSRHSISLRRLCLGHCLPMIFSRNYAGVN